MNLSICTISFRHQLISVDEIARWAQQNHFQGIELWGIHAKNLSDQPHYSEKWLREYGLKVTMISDYLNLSLKEQALFYKVQLLARLAKHWGAKKIRTFAGDTGSLETSPSDRKVVVKRLQKICGWLKEHDIELTVETHPNSLADSLTSTLQLLDEVALDNLKLNFDVLHVWESKADPLHALELLQNHINHFHLKNISSADLLNVFNPPNVYAASGSREGMTPLFEGAYDFTEFFQCLLNHSNRKLINADASLEWFGNNSKNILMRDRYLIQQIQQRSQLIHVLS